MKDPIMLHSLQVMLARYGIGAFYLRRTQVSPQKDVETLEGPYSWPYNPYNGMRTYFSSASSEYHLMKPKKIDLAPMSFDEN